MNAANMLSRGVGLSMSERLKEHNLSLKLAKHLECYLSYWFSGGADPGDDWQNAMGAALQHFKRGEVREIKTPIVVAYTPEFDRHGWHSQNTVIDVVTDDMSFLVDSVTMVLDRRGLSVHKIVHPVIGCLRDASGVLQETADRDADGFKNESWMHLEIDRLADADQAESLINEIRHVLADVRSANEDARAMLSQIDAAVADLNPSFGARAQEVAAFLRWVQQGNFVFLGYAEQKGGGNQANEILRLGVLRDNKHPRYGRCLAGLPAETLAEVRDAELALAKTDCRSNIHRPGILDLIEVRCASAEGHAPVVHSFVGLYAANVYHVSVREIPFIREKVDAVRQALGFAEGGHKDNALLNVLETFPRDDLIEIDFANLIHIVTGLVALHEHPRVAVFMRNDPSGRYVSALIYMPRDRYDTNVRARITQAYCEMLQPDSVDFFLLVGESRLARMQLVAHLSSGKVPSYDVAAFEATVAKIVRGWHDELQSLTIEQYGAEKGNVLLRRYARQLPLAYQDQVPVGAAVSDLAFLERAEAHGQIEVKLCAPSPDENAHQHIRLFLDSMPRPLSALLPVFDNLGLCVLSEQPYLLHSSHLHIDDFAVRLPSPALLDQNETRAAFIDLLSRVLRNEAENDGFNRLVLLAGLAAPQVNVLRAYAHYLRQAGVSFSIGYIQQCLASHSIIARQLIELFEARLSPVMLEDETAVLARLDASLEQISAADDDRILNALRSVILATVRTNAWQKDGEGQLKDYLSFKLVCKEIPFLPKPLPFAEIFVYSYRMEGVHLRGARVARGGLRWSDRMEDYRTEGLALMKAQMVKNVVGVPLGAKGCFVGKRLPPSSDRDAYQQEGVACYQIYIRGLLDLTDNLVAGKVVPPKGVRRRDGDDPYLVVAADKGTATFSDIANAISAEYGFWLGDAFASGGSRGYDHKKMAITARGAWEAVKRHFREIGRDIQHAPFTAVGIGDMSGDVFGNGALRSNCMQLVAAFDHRHIFLDPTPNALATFNERQRLFDLPRSSWDDFDRHLISQGGGVFSRAAKVIEVSAEACERLGIAHATNHGAKLTPNELIAAILKAPVDLIYNGGIGTYVKASTESHAEANDRANDALRVDATELRAKVVGEGGNLGFTQKARIEYAAAGGRINTDAVDNSGGVGCSDHEVNIKILLSMLIAQGDMTEKQRDVLLAELTEEIGRDVLVDNYQQTLAISLEVAEAPKLLRIHAQLIRALESKMGLDRALESLPTDKLLFAREQAGLGLTRPEIATLFAHAKIYLKARLLETNLPSHPRFAHVFRSYFSLPILEVAGHKIDEHPLRCEIVATRLVNQIVNRMGMAFVLQMSDASGTSLDKVFAAWSVVSDLLAAESRWAKFEAKDERLEWVEQSRDMLNLRQAVAGASRQLLLASSVADESIKLLCNDLAIIDLSPLVTEIQALLAEKPMDDALVSNVIENALLALQCGKTLSEITALTQKMGGVFDFAWFYAAVNKLPADNRWQARAKAQLQLDLMRLQRHVCTQNTEGVWKALSSAGAVMEDLRRSGVADLAMLSASLGEIWQVVLGNKS